MCSWENDTSFFILIVVCILLMVGVVGALIIMAMRDWPKINEKNNYPTTRVFNQKPGGIVYLREGELLLSDEDAAELLKQAKESKTGKIIIRVNVKKLQKDIERFMK